MNVRPFRFVGGAIHLPELGLWMDPHRAVTGPERVVVSHAHSDHTAAHREVILTEPTARLMRSRLGRGRRVENILRFHERTEFTWEGRKHAVTLLPAGHILGSAMVLLEWNNTSLLYTGDFKTRTSHAAEPCDVSAAKGVDILVMETTFGRPMYRFPPADEVMREVIRFCREALDRDEVPVLLGYSLGKSQELLRGLAGAGLDIMLHTSAERLTKIYEQMGQRFPAYELLDASRAGGKVLICPPGSTRSEALRGIARTKTALVTGWAVDPGCRYRSRVDAAFPLSDHAGFPELLEFVNRIAPRQIFTLHGFAADFAETLRALGHDARALGHHEQLSLPLGEGGL